VGDLGLRGFKGLLGACSRLLGREPFDALFVTIYPTYTALLGPVLKRKFGIPFALDYQDPWVGAWGVTVGSGPDGRPDVKSRLTRVLGLRLEPRVLRAADAVTAVSPGICEHLMNRYPWLQGTPCAAIPVGGDPADFDRMREQVTTNRYFDPSDGQIHLCHVGTLPPLGFETLRAVLAAVALLRERRPALYRRLRLHFIGGSGQPEDGAPERVRPLAREFGVDKLITEIPRRVEYLEALAIQADATALLMVGSTEPHYAASRLYPALFARRPILAVYHEASSVVATLRRTARPPSARLVVYDDTRRAGARVEAVYEELLALIERPSYEERAVVMESAKEYSSESLAGRLVAVLDKLGR
jgi:hypothetical protein